MHVPTIEKVAPAFNVELTIRHVPNVEAIEPTIEKFAGKANCGMIVLPDNMLDDQRENVIALAAKHRLPDLYGSIRTVATGGLLFYTSDWRDLYRRAASYVDQILKGAKSGELPIQQPTKFQFVINLKTARVLGLTVPPTLLARADEVVE
jgi:putative ABC transport system substrate-binding protein